MESTVSRLSKGGKYPSFTAAEIASSTRWLRGMKAGLAARIAARRSFASPPSSASRWRHLAAQSSKELGSVNRLRTPASPSGLTAASHSRRKIKVKSAPLRAMRWKRSSAIPARREELEGADPDVARRNAGQYRAGQRRLAPNQLAGEHNGER